MTDRVDISAFEDKATVLAALFNGAKQQGWAETVTAYTKDNMTPEGARAFLEEHLRSGFGREHPLTLFDVSGRSLYVDLSEDEFDPTIFDQKNGEGAAARAVASLYT